MRCSEGSLDSDRTMSADSSGAALLSANERVLLARAIDVSVLEMAVCCFLLQYLSHGACALQKRSQGVGF